MAKRRGNGEGSVYRRTDGRAVGEYVDANGKRRNGSDWFSLLALKRWGRITAQDLEAARPLR